MACTLGSSVWSLAIPSTPHLYPGSRGCILCHLNWAGRCAPLLCTASSHSGLSTKLGQALSPPSAGDSRGHKEQAQKLKPHRLELGSQPSASLMPQLPHLPRRDQGAGPAGPGRGEGLS